MIDENISLEELYKKAIETLKDIKTDEVFILKELFRGFEWNRIKKGDRTRLGSMFFSYSKNEGCKNIMPLEKTPQNQQKYKKI